MTGSGPLPRGLDPWPGEVLPGYLLRLAHRIGSTPFHIAERCGLTARTALPVQHLVRLDHATAQQFATACRLDPGEVHRLTLAGQAPAHPVLGVDYLGRHQTPTIMAAHGWVLTTASRFCPTCLAETEHAPGGPVWLGTWRLAHTFLCPRHHRILDWLCPACSAPAFSDGHHDNGRARSSRLVPNPHETHHPAACRHRTGPVRGRSRNNACGHDLTTTAGPATRLTPAMAHAHERLTRLTDTPPEDGTHASRFLHDVRATALILTGSWPTTRTLLADTPEARLINTYVETTTDSEWAARALTRPPANPHHAAALFALTITLLENPDCAETLTRLVSALLPISPARHRLRDLAPYVSPAMRALIAEPPTARRDGVGRAPMFPQPATYRGRFDPALVPVNLPDAWAGPLDTLGAPTRAIRRDAAIRLVQMATGWTRPDAAKHLSVPPGTYVATGLAIRRWLKEPGKAAAYQHALQQVAENVLRTRRGPPSDR